MPEPGKAPATAATLRITITYSSGNWDSRPPDPSNGAKVDNNGTVTFHCSQQGGCRVYTSPANAFVNEVNGYEQLNQGDNTYTLAVDDVNVEYCVCGPSDSCSPTQRLTLTGGYSIQVGNPPIEPDKGRR